MAAAVLDAVCPPRNPMRHREEADDDDDSVKITTVDRDEADDDGSSKFMAVDREEEADVRDIVRYCGDFVCKAPHIIDWRFGDRWFGVPLWDVISIKIRRNMKYHQPGSTVRIHGAIRVHNLNHFTDYLFKRNKADAQVFEDPAEELTLSLVGPHKPWVVDGSSDQLWFQLYGFLKYNDQDIFNMWPSRRTPEYYTKHLKGCPERYRDIDDGYWGDFEDCSDLFYGKEDHMDPVGFGVVCVPCMSIATEVSPTRIECHHGILDKVASVEVELAYIATGTVARLSITSSRNLELYGEITARSCRFENGVVLFHKTQKEAMSVKSNESIPLSRSMASVDSYTSLVIKVRVQDAKDIDFLVDETIQFNTLPKGCFSQKTTSNRVFSVNVDWTYERYEGPNIRFPDW